MHIDENVSIRTVYAGDLTKAGHILFLLIAGSEQQQHRATTARPSPVLWHQASVERPIVTRTFFAQHVIRHTSKRIYKWSAQSYLIVRSLSWVLFVMLLHKTQIGLRKRINRVRLHDPYLYCLCILSIPDTCTSIRHRL